MTTARMSPATKVIARFVTMLPGTGAAVFSGCLACGFRTGGAPPLRAGGLEVGRLGGGTGAACAGTGAACAGTGAGVGSAAGCRNAGISFVSGAFLYDRAVQGCGGPV